MNSFQTLGDKTHIGRTIVFNDSEVNVLESEDRRDALDMADNKGLRLSRFGFRFELLNSRRNERSRSCDTVSIIANKAPSLGLV